MQMHPCNPNHPPIPRINMFPLQKQQWNEWMHQISKQNGKLFPRRPLTLHCPCPNSYILLEKGKYCYYCVSMNCSARFFQLKCHHHHKWQAKQPSKRRKIPPFSTIILKTITTLPSAVVMKGDCLRVKVGPEEVSQSKTFNKCMRRASSRTWVIKTSVKWN